jgi:hypothetical protein
MAKKEKTTWKWNEYGQWKEQQNKRPTEPDKIPARSGVCQDCGGGSFKLKMAAAGKMDRICKNCGGVVENV